MRQVHPDELHHLNGGLLPVVVFPLLVMAFGAGFGLGIDLRMLGANCPVPAPSSPPPPGGPD